MSRTAKIAVISAVGVLVVIAVVVAMITASGGNQSSSEGREDNPDREIYTTRGAPISSEEIWPFKNAPVRGRVPLTFDDDGGITLSAQSLTEQEQVDYFIDLMENNTIFIKKQDGARGLNCSTLETVDFYEVFEKPTVSTAIRNVGRTYGEIQWLPRPDASEKVEPTNIDNSSEHTKNYTYLVITSSPWDESWLDLCEDDRVYRSVFAESGYNPYFSTLPRSFLTGDRDAFLRGE